MFSQSFESINPGQHQTIRYRDYLYEQCHGSTIQKVTQALDQVRKQLQSEQKNLKKKRLLFLMSLEKFSDKQKVRLDELLEECPDIAHATT